MSGIGISAHFRLPCRGAFQCREVVFFQFHDTLVAYVEHFFGMGDAENFKGGEFRGFDIKIGVVSGIMDTRMDAHQKGAHDDLGETADFNRFLERTDIGDNDLMALTDQRFHGNIVEKAAIGIGGALHFHG